MNKIQKLHLKAIEKNISVEGRSEEENAEKIAFESANITKQIAIEFSAWCANSHFHYYYNGEVWTWANARTQEYFTTEELFSKFLKTKKNDKA